MERCPHDERMKENGGQNLSNLEDLIEEMEETLEEILETIEEARDSLEKKRNKQALELIEEAQDALMDFLGYEECSGDEEDEDKEG